MKNYKLSNEIEGEKAFIAWAEKFNPHTEESNQILLKHKRHLEELEKNQTPTRRKGKVERLYYPDEGGRAFFEMEQMKAKGYSGTMSFFRGKTADIKIKIVYIDDIKEKNG